MIELRAGAIGLPAVCIVAIIAGTSKLDFLEGPVVLIGVTALAAAMGQIFELSILLTGPRSVALLAGLRLMQSREREVRGADDLSPTFAPRFGLFDAHNIEIDRDPFVAAAHHHEIKRLAGVKV